jgi:dienelactone hydrolase
MIPSLQHSLNQQISESLVDEDNLTATEMTAKNSHPKRSILLFSLLLAFSVSFAQNCGPLTLDSIDNPGDYTYSSLTESDGIRNGPDYSGATIYYPTNATPPFASIAIVPGYLSPQSSIQDWGPFLASHGIVVMTIGTNSIFNDPSQRRDGLLDAIVTIAEENTRIDSPLFGNIDTDKFAVGGWSMGGGGAQLAAAADQTLKAVVALCPWLDAQTTPANLDHPVPVLIFSGEIDVIAPPSAHANVHYDYTPQATDKLLFELNNAGHNVANSPTGGQDQIGKIALSWLQHYLIGDSCYCPLLLDTPSAASNYMTNVICPENTTSIDPLVAKNKNSYQLYPSPCSRFITLEVEHTNGGKRYEILSLAGVNISSGLLFTQTTKIDVQHLASGIYFMNVITPLSSERIKFIVL